MPRPSAIEILRDSVERHRALWRARLGGQRGGWDRVVITAAGERQAHGYRLQLAWREREGLWPRGRDWTVVPDPGGRRIGAGLAMVNGLLALGRPAWTADARILVLNCGGSSVRMPHCSAFGKMFAPLPCELRPAVCSTIFDENLALLERVADVCPPGVTVAAGDVLLALDPAAHDWPADGPSVVTVEAPAERGAGHGVFLQDARGDGVRRVLQKWSPERLREVGAIDTAGHVLIDTGLFHFPWPFIDPVLREAEAPQSVWREALALGVEIDLYTEMSIAMASEARVSDLPRRGDTGEAAEAGRRAVESVWRLFHGRAPFRLVRCTPGRFYHLGSTRDYCEALQPETEVAFVYGFQRVTASDGVPADTKAVILCSQLEPRTRLGAGAVIDHCRLCGASAIGAGAFAAGLSGTDIRLASGLAAFGAPVRSERLAGRVTVVYGVGDNPKLGDGATFMNLPMGEWCAARGIRPADLWPDSGTPHTLWTARLYPLEPADAGLSWLAWFQLPAEQARSRLDDWRRSSRLSLKEIFEMTDCESLLSRGGSGDAAADLIARVQGTLMSGSDENIAELCRDLSSPEDILALKTSLEQFAVSVPCTLRRARAFKVLGDLMADGRLGRLLPARPTPPGAFPPVPPDNPAALFELWSRAYEELAFAHVRLAIESSVRTTSPPLVTALEPGVVVEVELPARIDLGGGWSDTPPHSLEKGGAVLNLALTIDGRRPIRATARTLREPVIRLGSRDLGVTQDIGRLEELLTYDDLEDPLALLKAATVYEGLVAPDSSGRAHDYMSNLGAGIELLTECDLPKGSGMGSSSIVACAAVCALTVAFGRKPGVDQMFRDVLCVEQMMTTGGGWQDQIGGMVGGIKYTRTTAEAPLVPEVKKLDLSDELVRTFNRRLVVFYTGRNRLAKNILRQIMSDYISRRQPVFGVLKDIRRTADELVTAFEAGDLAAVGRLMSRSWALNKRLNPTVSNPEIDALFEAAAPYIHGGKLAGAGGGGFMVLLARDDSAAGALRARLRALSEGTDRRLHEARLDMEGLHYETHLATR